MRRLYLAATVLFWLLVAAFWAGSRGLPPAEESVAVVTEKSFSAGELVSHVTPENCWMAIRGSVYDLSAYLPEHPSRPEVILPWCGKEATEAYNTKTKGRAHKPYADDLLAQYRIGKLTPAQP